MGLPPHVWTIQVCALCCQKHTIMLCGECHENYSAKCIDPCTHLWEKDCLLGIIHVACVWQLEFTDLVSCSVLQMDGFGVDSGLGAPLGKGKSGLMYRILGTKVAHEAHTERARPPVTSYHQPTMHTHQGLQLHMCTYVCM